jgi:DNA-binding HxlR family transcriptional regulator
MAPAIASILNVLGGGAAGEILLALGRGPLRTKQLTKRVPRFASRTVYRRVATLVELGLIDRREQAGVPSTVVHRLKEPAGRELVRLLKRYGPPAVSISDVGKINESSWVLLSLLGEMWSSGWIDQFSRGVRTPTELSESTPGWTFHQVNRRLHLLASVGLLKECEKRGRGRHYQLTEEARRATGLVAALGRWRQRHAVGVGGPGLLVQEMATVTRTCLPLVALSTHRDVGIRLGIAGVVDGNGGSGSAVLHARANWKGTIHCSNSDSAPADGWAIGTVETWLGAMLDGSRGRMRVGGDLKLVDSCLIQLHESLLITTGKKL